MLIRSDQISHSWQHLEPNFVSNRLVISKKIPLKAGTWCQNFPVSILKAIHHDEMTNVTNNAVTNLPLVDFNTHKKYQVNWRSWIIRRNQRGMYITYIQVQHYMPRGHENVAVKTTEGLFKLNRKYGEII
jgi:hypothetical protein